jgi:hypothetical protein
MRASWTGEADSVSVRGDCSDNWERLAIGIALTGCGKKL